MKNKSVFSYVLLLIIIAAFGIAVTVGLAFFIGALDKSVIDFGNLNLSNVITVLVIGGFVTCVAIGITALFTAKTMFFKVKDFLTEQNENNKNGGKKK